MTQANKTANNQDFANTMAIVVGAFVEHLDDEAAVELGRGLANLVKRFTIACHGAYTPEFGMFDTFMLAALQNREVDTVRKWCESKSVPLRKAGRPNSFKGADVIEAARGGDDGEVAAGKG